MNIKSALKNRIHIYKEYRKKDFSLGNSLILTLISVIYDFYKISRMKYNRKNKIIKTKLFNNKLFFVSGNDSGLSFDLIINNGIREPIATKKIIEIVKNNSKNFKCFLDIGANIGYYTIILSDYFEKIICVEPNKKCIRLLKKNIVTNNLYNKTHILNSAVGYKSGKIGVIEKKDMNLTEVCENKGDYLIDVVPLDDLFNKYKPDLVKLDIEGFEYALFFNIKNFKYLPKVFFIEIHFDKKSYDENIRLLKILENFGYKIRYAIWEEKGITYLKNKNLLFKIAAQTYIKLLKIKDPILCKNYSIDQFCKENKKILKGRLGAVEFILELAANQ